jgi:serine/threonine-protein kinase
MHAPVAGSVIAGKYRLDRPLAEGAEDVWRAWNVQLGVPAAIKLVQLMEPGLAGADELAARFEREAQAAAWIRSPHVAQSFEHGVEGEVAFLVMELLEGEDLEARMRRVGRLSIRETARVVDGACKALRRAHELGVVHRDLGPSKIFLAKDEDGAGGETVKVLGFGVVRSMGEAAGGRGAKAGEPIGAPCYASPERARGAGLVDRRSDLWSLGVIAYRALAGSLPFPGEDEAKALLLRICHERCPPPSRYAPDLGAEVDRFFERALAISLGDRFQTASQMAAALNALAEKAEPPREVAIRDEPRSEGEIRCPPPAALRASAPPKSPAPPAQGGDVSSLLHQAPAIPRELAIPHEAPAIVEVPAIPREVAIPPEVATLAVRKRGPALHTLPSAGTAPRGWEMSTQVSPIDRRTPDRPARQAPRPIEVVALPAVPSLVIPRGELGVETGGHTPETAGRAPETRGRAPETSGRAPETSGRAPETSGRAPETSGRAPETRGRTSRPPPSRAVSELSVRDRIVIPVICGIAGLLGFSYVLSSRDEPADAASAGVVTTAVRAPDPSPSTRAPAEKPAPPPIAAPAPSPAESAAATAPSPSSPPRKSALVPSQGSSRARPPEPPAPDVSPLHVPPGWAPLPTARSSPPAR